jgi:7-cyano-7-deazaguanine tRNA-ribosyltransferase
MVVIPTWVKRFSRHSSVALTTSNPEISTSRQPTAVKRSHSAKFTVLHRDATTKARAGLLKVNGHTIKTPVLWLGHNFKGPVALWNGGGVRVNALLVNAYEILRIHSTTQSVSTIGMGEFLDYHGPIMMDSGGFLFQNHAKMHVHPSRIHELYQKGKVDIGVALDHPLNPSLSALQSRKRWERTLRNTEAMAKLDKSYAFMPVVHGYALRSLLNACRQIKNVVGTTALVGVGSLVPLMKASHIGDGFRYRRNGGAEGDHVTYFADALALIREEFPKSCLHVFGVGGITTALSVFALGADSVDSVGWRLKAAYGAIQLPGISDRFLAPRPDSPKPRRVLNASDEKLLARCACPTCQSYESLAWQKRRLDGSFKARCVHNGSVFLKEVTAFRKAVLRSRGNSFIGKNISKSHRLFPLFNAHEEPSHG